MDNFDPDLEELEASLLTEAVDSSFHGEKNWSHEYSLTPMDENAHGLTALSTAATQNHYTYNETSTPSTRNNSTSLPTLPGAPPLNHTIPSPARSRSTMPPPASPSTSITSSNNNINFLLNPPSSMSPSTEPRLSTPLGGKDSPYTPKTPTSRNTAISLRPERRVETSHEIAFLLRHFAEGPGYW